jgi:hypothetical protein
MRLNQHELFSKNKSANHLIKGICHVYVTRNCIEMCLILLAIIEMQIKTTIKH